MVSLLSQFVAITIDGPCSFPDSGVEIFRNKEQPIDRVNAELGHALYA